MAMSADVRILTARPASGPARTAAETALATAFEQVKARLPGNTALAARREAAFARFAAAGLPHRRVEEWRYTDLRQMMRDMAPLVEAPAQPLTSAPQSAGLLAQVEARRLYVVDGAFVPGLSDLADLESGLTILSLAEALRGDVRLGDVSVAERLDATFPCTDVMAALNTAFMADGLVIHLAEGVELKRPLEFIHVNTRTAPVSIYTRSLVVLEKDAKATLVESHDGPDGVAYQVNTALELVVGEGAQLNRVKLVREGDAALHIATVLLDVAGSALLKTAHYTLGGRIVRNQIFSQLSGEEIHAVFGGVSMLSNQQHSDTSLAVEHLAPNCESRENFRAVLDGRARDVFQGRIAVRREAQKTDARMMTRALLLSDTAEADNKPELEIFADDVQCAHGCTTGNLDEQVKFYLMARGIPEKEAEALLIQAFVGEVLDTIENEGVRDALIEATRVWLKDRN